MVCCMILTSSTRPSDAAYSENLMGGPGGIGMPMRFT